MNDKKNGNSLKTVSVIIPTYYRHSELENLFKCLENQTITPLEIIVVDQTPQSDRPPGFYNKYKKSLPLRVINIDLPSSTISRNTGANFAKGDILCFFDDKIIGEPNLIESHLQVLEEENVDVVHGAIFHPDRCNGKLPDKFSWMNQREILDPAMIFMISANSVWKGMTLGVCTANMCIKRDLYLQVGGMDEKMSGRYDDIEFAYRLYRAGAKMFFSPKPVIRNKRVYFGGAYTKKVGIWSRLFKPDPHPNYLYFHMKHLPGWSTTQLILKPICETYGHPVSWLKRPWKLILTPIRVGRSVTISRRMLR